MTHDEFDSLIAISLAGGLADEEMAAFEAHRAGCAACARALEEGEAFERAVTGELAPYRAPADLADRIVAAHDAVRPARRWRVPGWVLKPALAAAAAGAMIAVGAWGTREEPAFTDEVRAKLVAQSGIDDAIAKIEWAKEPSYAWEYDGFISYENVDDFAIVEGNPLGLDVDPDYARRWPIAGEWGGQAAMEHTEALNQDLERLIELQRELRGHRDEAREAVIPYSKMVKFPTREEWKKIAERGLKPLPADVEYEFIGAADRIEMIKDDLKIIRTATMEIEVDAYTTAADRAAAVAADLGGLVAGESREKLPNGKLRGQITLRVPAAAFDEAVRRLQEIGDVRNQNTSAQDVGKAYVDLQSRLKNAQTLEERLRKLIEEGKGEVKDLLAVEQELAKVRERIEQMTGELKYYDQQIALSTLTLSIAERDLEQPAEFVETQAAVVDLAAADIDYTYNGAREAVEDAGGQVLESKLNRRDDGVAEGTIKALIPAEKFERTVEAIKALGVVEKAVIDVRESSAGAALGAKRRREAGIVELSIHSPREVQRAGADLRIEAADVAGAYAKLRAQFASGELRDAKIAHSVDGAQALVVAMVPISKFDGAVASVEALGTVKERTIARDEQVLKTPSKEVGRLNVLLVTPPKLIPEEEGFGATVERTWSECATGLLWSVEKLLVGAAYLVVWGLPVVGLWLLFRRLRRKAAAAPAASP